MMTAMNTDDDSAAYAQRLAAFIIDHIGQPYTHDECAAVLELRPDTGDATLGRLLRHLLLPDPDDPTLGVALNRVTVTNSTTNRRRLAVTDQRLVQVAYAYNHGGSAGVTRYCAVSRSQAFRLINQARAAGHLPPKGDDEGA